MQVHRFLGTICGMLQIFIWNFTAITRPLVGLMQKGIPFKWGKAQCVLQFVSYHMVSSYFPFYVVLIFSLAYVPMIGFIA